MMSSRPPVASDSRVTRSRHRVGVGYVGPLPTELYEVVATCHSPGVAVSSNYARERSTYLALAASIGWVSTVSLDGHSFGRVWHATLEGLHALTSRISTDADG